MAKPFKLSDTIQKTGMGRLKKLALLDYTIRLDITNLLKEIGLDEKDILTVAMFIKFNDETNTLEVKISARNMTIHTFLKTRQSSFESLLIPSKYSLANISIRL